MSRDNFLVQMIPEYISSDAFKNAEHNHQCALELLRFALRDLKAGNVNLDKISERMQKGIDDAEKAFESIKI